MGKTRDSATMGGMRSAPAGANNPPDSPPFSGTTLELVLLFGMPDDVARASMVCKTWRDDLTPKQQPSDDEDESSARNNSEFVWKQVARNRNPDVFRAIMESTGTATASAHPQPSNREPQQPTGPADFFSLARTLSRKRKRRELPEPTLRLEDVLLIVQLKQVKRFRDESGEVRTVVESLGAWPCSLSHLQRNESVSFCVSSEATALLEAPNHLHQDNIDLLWPAEYLHRRSPQNLPSYLSARREELRTDLQVPEESRGTRMVPVERAGLHAAEHDLQVSVLLFRRDIRRSIYLMENTPSPDDSVDPEFDDTTEELKVETIHVAWPDDCIARTERGHVARDVLEDNTFVSMYTRVRIRFEAVLPKPGSDDEPKWLHELRKHDSQEVDWTDQEYEDLYRIRNFQFRPEKIELSFSGFSLVNDDLGNLEDTNAFLLLLEGLDWQ